MTAIINSYKRKLQCAIKRKGTDNYLSSFNRNQFFFTYSKVNTLRFETIEKAYSKIEDQLALLNVSESRQYMVYSFYTDNENTNETIQNYSKMGRFPNGVEFEITYLNYKNFQLHCYSLEKTIDFEIVLLRR